MTKVAPGRGGLVLLLGLLTAFGPMSIDMYLPAFPAIAREFGVPIATVQYTVAAYMGGLALGQLLYGPLADQYGRKPFLLAGLVVYALASLGCATSTSVASLIGWRVLQAVGGCAGAVLGFAIVRDEFEGNAAARIFSTMLLVMGVAPILAPTVGSVVVAHMSWRLIFWVLAGLAALSIAAVAFGLRETLPPARRNPLAVRRAFHTYDQLLRDRAFVGYALTSGLVLGAMFAYITGSPFVFTQLYGLSTQQYGLLFGLNASGLIAASQLNNWLLRHYAFPQILRGVTWAALLAGLALLLMADTGWGGLYGLEVPLFVVVSCVGLASPNATAGALQRHAAHAGSAASLLGTLSYSCGTLAALATSALANDTTRPMALVVAACGALACGLYHWLVGAAPEPVSKPASAAGLL